MSLQGIISAAKELDYEISHGRYTLMVTATDQCPILPHRLTSTTTVSGWGTARVLGRGTGPRQLQEGQKQGEEHSEENAYVWGVCPWPRNSPTFAV